MTDRPATKRAARRTRPLLLRDEERYRLLFGPYQPPVAKGGFLVDELRGKVPFGSFTNALIPWPKARRQGRGGSGGFVLCGDLLRALKHESIPAISHHWGVSRATVGNWRRALELISRTELTAGAKRLVDLGVELSKLPESRKKFSEAARGRTLSAARKARLFAGIRKGWQERFQARRAAYRRTGRFPTATKSDPWISEEEKLLSTLPTAELVRVLGRTTKSIQARRLLLGIRARPPIGQRPWRQAEIRVLGTGTDRKVAKRLGRSVSSVEKKRWQLGIQAPGNRPWVPTEEALLGKVPDDEVAHRLGRTLRAVQHHRVKLGMAFFHVESRGKWSAAEVALLGTAPDAAIAKKLRRTVLGVRLKRRKQGVPAKAATRRWTRPELATLGTMSDIEAARKLGRTVSAIRGKRLKCRIAPGRNRRYRR